MALVRKRNKNEVRRALYGWIAWTPLLAIFVVMAMDTSLSLKVRSAEREFGTLDAKLRQTTMELGKARAQEAQWSDIGRVAGIIARLNMLLPDPEQIQVVIAHPNTPMPGMKERPREGALEMADSSGAAGSASPRTVPTAPAVALPVMASAPTVTAAKAALVPANPPSAVSAPAVAVASRPAAPSATSSTMLDLPKEQITDLDSPDAPTNNLLANL